MTTMNVLDAAGGVIPVEKPLPPGRAAAASSRPVALSNEDKLALDAINSALATLAGLVDGLEALGAAATPAGSNLIGRTVADASAATGGLASTARLPSSAASTNATNVKTSAGRVYQVSGKNNAAYDVFLVLYDAATNPPVPGTTTIRKKIVCPAGQAFVYDWYVGLSCASGIGYAFTKLVADADTTVVASGDITAFNLDYV